MLFRSIFTLCLALAAPAALAQTPPAATAEAPAPAPAFQARLDQLVPLLRGGGDYADFFAPAFVAQVPETQFRAITKQLTDSNGPVGAIEGMTLASPWSGTLSIGFRDAVVTVGISVDPAEPHQVNGLRILGAGAREKTLEEVTGAIRALPGRTAYAFARLDQGAPQLLAAHDADRPFGVGSAFKLVILAELVRVTNAGTRKWDDLVTLDGSQLPGGGYTAKPAGTQVSLRELATQMISISDNSATDILLKTLGRDKVEAMLATIGVQDPARNRPFLGTLEAFKLKYLSDGALGRRYAALDEAGRRALLAGEIARTPLVAIPAAPPGGRKPAMIDTIEWFLSPADMVRVMDWLRRNTEGPSGEAARAILSKNPGIPPAAASRWQWVGYKGGSEPGLIHMTLLLQAKSGDWYALTASWNDTSQPVAEIRFAALVGRIAELAAP